MYYIYDFKMEKYLKLESQTDVVNWWKSRMGHNFGELNITGNDMRYVQESDGFTKFTDRDGVNHSFQNYKYVPYLRRYQVFDNEMRSIDIRDWPKTIWDYHPTYKYSSWRYTGRKDHQHRMSGPAMLKNTLLTVQDHIDKEELLEQGLPLPIINKTDVRKGFLFGGTDDVWSFYDKKRNHKWSSSKSWKDQQKNRKQWAKHKHGSHCRPVLETTEPIEDIFARLEGDGFPVPRRLNTVKLHYCERIHKNVLGYRISR